MYMVFVQYLCFGILLCFLVADTDLSQFLLVMPVIDIVCIVLYNSTFLSS